MQDLQLAKHLANKKRGEKSPLLFITHYTTLHLHMTQSSPKLTPTFPLLLFSVFQYKFILLLISPLTASQWCGLILVHLLENCYATLSC
nr:MAG TPA: hypothetical protein [Caudoviricetes sp.]